MIFRRYGFLILLGAMSLVAIWAFSQTNETEVRKAAETECQIKSLIETNGKSETAMPWYECLDPGDESSRFWDGFWENHQSEYVQLFFQGLLLIALGSWIAYRDHEGKVQAAREGARQALAEWDANRNPPTADDSFVTKEET